MIDGSVSLFGVTLTITAIYGILSVLVLFLFMIWWLMNRKKRTGQPIFAGQVMNSVGFGLLPALAVLKAFQHLGTGKGNVVIRPLPMVRWLSEEGYYLPMRIESAAAVLFFILICLWLIIRKNDFPDNGDLILIAVCIWASIRLVTEEFRRDPQMLFHYTSGATILFCLAVWTIRRARMSRAPLRTAADLTAVCLCLVVNIITAKGILSAGSGIADFAVMTGSAALALLLTLITGSDVRRLQEKRKTNDQPG